MSRASTRKAAAEAADKPTSPLSPEPDETTRAREWGTKLAARVAPSPAEGTRS
jgi:hypothetical protein